MGPMTTMPGLAAKLKSRLGNLYNLYPLGGSTGGIVVRQPGGVAGTDEVWLYDDGTVSYIRGMNSYVRLQNAAGVTMIQYDASSNEVNFGSSSVTVSRTSALRLIINDDANYMTSGSADWSFGRVAAGVCGQGTASSIATWFQNTPGRRVLTADVTNDSATLATTGLTVNVLASRKVSFAAILPVTTAAVLEGVKVALSGTATITNLIADIEVKSHAATPVFTMGRVTAFDSAIGQTVADAGNATVEIQGTLEVNGAGTLRIDFAKNADTGAANTTIKRGAWFFCEDMP